jgi:hypothetical protein
MSPSTLQNNEETFEILFPALQGSNYELISLLCLIGLSVFAFIRLRRSPKLNLT